MSILYSVSDISFKLIIFDDISFLILKYVDFDDLKNLVLIDKFFYNNKMLKKFIFIRTPYLILYKLGIDYDDIKNKDNQLKRNYLDNDLKFLFRGSDFSRQMVLINTCLIYNRIKTKKIRFLDLTRNYLPIGKMIKIKISNKSVITNLLKEIQFKKKPYLSALVDLEDLKRYNRYFKRNFRSAYSLTLATGVKVKSFSISYSYTNSIV